MARTGLAKEIQSLEFLLEAPQFDVERILVSNTDELVVQGTKSESTFAWFRGNMLTLPPQKKQRDPEYPMPAKVSVPDIIVSANDNMYAIEQHGEGIPQGVQLFDNAGTLLRSTLMQGRSGKRANLEPLKRTNSIFAVSDGTRIFVVDNRYHHEKGLFINDNPKNLRKEYTGAKDAVIIEGFAGNEPIVRETQHRTLRKGDGWKEILWWKGKRWNPVRQHLGLVFAFKKGIIYCTNTNQFSEEPNGNTTFVHHNDKCIAEVKDCTNTELSVSPDEEHYALACGKEDKEDVLLVDGKIELEYPVINQTLVWAENKPCLRIRDAKEPGFNPDRFKGLNKAYFAGRVFDLPKVNDHELVITGMRSDKDAAILECETTKTVGTAFDGTPRTLRAECALHHGKLIMSDLNHKLAILDEKVVELTAERRVIKEGCETLTKIYTVLDRKKDFKATILQEPGEFSVSNATGTQRLEGTLLGSECASTFQTGGDGSPCVLFLRQGLCVPMERSGMPYLRYAGKMIPWPTYKTWQPFVEGLDNVLCSSQEGQHDGKKRGVGFHHTTYSPHPMDLLGQTLQTWFPNADPGALITTLTAVGERYDNQMEKYTDRTYSDAIVRLTLQADQTRNVGIFCKISKDKEALRREVAFYEIASIESLLKPILPQLLWSFIDKESPLGALLTIDTNTPWRVDAHEYNDVRNATLSRLSSPLPRINSHILDDIFNISLIHTVMKPHALNPVFGQGRASLILPENRLDYCLGTGHDPLITRFRRYQSLENEVDQHERQYAETIIHGDARPDNVFPRQDGLRPRGDFGCARLGTPAYDLAKMTNEPAIVDTLITPVYSHCRQLLEAMRGRDWQQDTRELAEWTKKIAFFHHLRASAFRHMKGNAEGSEESLRIALSYEPLIKTS